jgi:cyanocobalamin reductase (cyanide-eliminating) / alkylcobalamin dealkylase
VNDEPLAWQSVNALIAEGCVRAGLDLIHPFGIDREPSSSALARIAVPDFRCRRGLGILIGNTRALWPILRRELSQDPALRAATDPLDHYVVRVVNGVRAALAVPSVARFAHVVDPEPFPIQRIAAEVGLCHLSPSHLSLHPEHGPWIALRAVLLFDVEGPLPLSAPRDPCSPCPKPCLTALHAAIQSSGAEGGIDVERHWQRWLAVRDACPEGRSSRYGDDQIAYHYSKDRRWLTPRSG